VRQILKALLWGVPIGALPIIIRYTVDEPSLFWAALALPGFTVGLLCAGGHASDAKNVNDLIVLIFNIVLWVGLTSSFGLGFCSKGIGGGARSKLSVHLDWRDLYSQIQG